ncbi:lecithin retinol acyltransferase family protein [Clostridiaceae bacterium UIB06]|uniref:Lecithin retinol acyltransferase family protein n=1 Tax=Clostridium thailandense TaxID=2794346 RepID=A0A949TKM8_9CLOT|nr:lecithin retinol acyltransferase family protein [Clostridium thailandense]MBV7274065.1 lecithin retinol acyltransferase family protein [Clostridium thailandense]MCH5137711.1 lecithin retinol acyltransferase family protein [Clostridiaceae bacterium UIB06]
MNKYFKDGSYFVLDFKDTSKFTPEEVIKSAKERLGEKSYDLLQNNCEDFVIWCKTNNSKSFQVDAIPKSQLSVLK